MAPFLPLDIDPNELEYDFDHATVSRGVEYANERRISDLKWSADGLVVGGRCRGARGQSYRVEADLDDVGGGDRELIETRCSCPVGYNCKHGVALLLAASYPQPGLSIVDTASASAWRRLLGDLAPDTPDVSEVAGNALLGILVEMPGATANTIEAPTLRLVTPGKTGAWVRTGVSWQTIEPGHRSAWNRSTRDHAPGYFVPEQLGPVRAIGRAFRANHPYGMDQTLDLALAPAEIWDLLDAAVDAGVTLVAHAKTTHTSTIALLSGSSAQLRVIRDDEGLAVAPSIALDGYTWDGSPAEMIGDPEPHGIVARSEDTLLLGPFTPPPSIDALQELFSRGVVRIPDDEAEEFTSEFLPRLVDVMPVQVADDALEVAETTGPELLLTLRPTDAGTRATWEVVYQVNGQRRTFEGEHRSGIRDRRAENAAWQAIRPHLEQAARLCVTWRRQMIAYAAHVVGGPGLIELVQQDPDDLIRAADIRQLTRSLVFTPMETAMLHVEVIPQLEELGVEVAIHGEVLDYREARSAPQISIGADGFGDSDWFGLAITIDVDGQSVPLPDVLAELSAEATHMLLADGTYFALDTPELSRLAALVAEAKALGELENGQVRQRSVNATLWEELLALGVVDKELAVWRSRMERLAAATPPEPCPTPDGFRAELRDYQTAGLTWLNFLWENRIGGILADDMGLGKTVQTLAMVAAALNEEPDGRFLVVAPTSVISNWVAEAERFVPDLDVLAVTATSARVGVPLAERVAGKQVVVTSYALMRIGFDEFDEIDWTGILFDEAQFVKNHNSKGYQCARRLRADFKVAITGTPMENNLMELWALLTLTVPGLFSSPKTFTEFFRKPIESGQEPERLALLRRRIHPVMLRRTKEQVAADLPAKQEQVLSIDLNTKHDKIYQTRLTRERQKVLGLLGDFDENRFAIFRSLTMLRQLSLHAGLVEDKHAEVASAKIDYLAEQIPELIAEGHSTLVFSQFTGFLRLIEDRLVGLGIDVSYLDGSMSAKQRGAEIKRFASGKTQVFLISLKAGGFGLNLTEADYCFVCDPWWNPASEAQAVDRAHRIGQTRPVNVYRLVSAGTIEEKVVALQERKRELFNAVIDEGDLFGSAISADDIRELIGG
ncbi:DEAD/DEAH box helicase [Gordonia sp. VNQ95]|uniref:DEAD/DEAH box helicase n=1 Tax=Gordonia TaxID=2053 RepID=UPI0032B4BFCF